MKRMLALLTALLMLLTAALAEETSGEATHLTVGNPTPMRGEFFTELWGSDTSDLDVRDLLHGYDLIVWDGSLGMFSLDPTVVLGYAVTEDAEGNRSYVLVLHDDLRYSDGSPITAWDYAFSFLLQSAPEIEAIGGTPLRRDHLLGFADYEEGRTPRLAGVRVLSGDTLLITIDRDYLPFFYEKGLLACRPYPISVIAPGVTVRDDGEGVYLANADESLTEPLFTAELLRKTILDPEEGYLSHPAVVSGPYTLTSWDGVTADFALNPWYKGNFRGKKPTIDTLTFTLADNETMVEQLISGEFGLLDKVMRADAILKGVEAVNTGSFRMSDYPRLGLGGISFSCERPTVSSLAVRQAIAWCLDRDAVTSEYTGAFGQRVDGYYGLGQWMVGLLNGSLTPPAAQPDNPEDPAQRQAREETLAGLRSLSLDGLTVYTADTGRAAVLLDADGWELNPDGLREKDGVVLDLKLVYPEGNVIHESLEKHLTPNLEKVGIRLTMEAMPMSELLTCWYRQGERNMDMIFVASNFDLVFDPSLHFQAGEDGKPSWAYTGLADEELWKRAVEMRQTSPGDVLTYMRRWVAFQERFNEILPMLPIYSNMYFDFYVSGLQDYMITENVTWGEAIVDAYLTGE